MSRAQKSFSVFYRYAVLLSILVSISVIAFSMPAGAQNRVDLDDLNIKGELLNDNRLRLSARDPHKMAERVTYRENFRPEVIDHLEVAWPESKAAEPKPASVDNAGGVGPGNASSAATSSGSGAAK